MTLWRSSAKEALSQKLGQQLPPSCRTAIWSSSNSDSCCSLGPHRHSEPTSVATQPRAKGRPARGPPCSRRPPPPTHAHRQLAAPRAARGQAHPALQVAAQVLIGLWFLKLRAAPGLPWGLAKLVKLPGVRRRPPRACSVTSQRSQSLLTCQGVAKTLARAKHLSRPQLLRELH